MGYVINVRRILRCFEVASGLHINFQKTCVMKVGKEKSWATSMRCNKASLPIRYLGLTLGGHPCSKLFWSDLIHRF
ncbi:hypothetical protein Dsin_021028 [Dipteronia sinensis]|uniref:Reverse transcriptase domain-containing protein n=1 Tax=Dipteronia sinensis TaxID=43782 RepID=A0AAE0E438_9ROSI|nr:hypothetical protein Dsin_021028 [Dipteronia sinensis]